MITARELRKKQFDVILEYIEHSLTTAMYEKRTSICIDVPHMFIDGLKDTLWANGYYVNVTTTGLSISWEKDREIK